MADGVYSRRFQTIAEMARETAGQVTSSVEAWKHFLDTAGEVYRYPFMDQLLIHRQRPDAKAVAMRAESTLLKYATYTLVAF